MAHIRIETPTGTGKSDGKHAFAGHGTKIFVDGHELTSVREIVATFRYDSVVTVDVKMMPTEPGMVLEGEFMLNVEITPRPDWWVVEEWLTPTKRVWRTHPAPTP